MCGRQECLPHYQCSAVVIVVVTGVVAPQAEPQLASLAAAAESETTGPPAGVVVSACTGLARLKWNKLAAWTGAPNCQAAVAITSRTEATTAMVGIANLLAADIPATTSWTTFAVAGETISSRATPSAASVAARVVAASKPPGTAATAGRANTAVMSAAEMARPRRDNRDFSSSRARDRRREIDPSGQPSWAAACALVLPSR